jgi:hypothetical protein
MRLPIDALAASGPTFYRIIGGGSNVFARQHESEVTVA